MTHKYGVYYRKVDTNTVDTWEGNRSQYFPYTRYGWQTYGHLFHTASYTKHNVPQNGISDTILTIFELIVTEAVRAEWQVRLPQQAVQLHAKY
jgi:hypothetical protein